MRFLAIALMFSLPVHADDQVMPVGDWVGLGHQDGETWKIELQVAEGGARVDYPGIPCGGVWVFDAEHLVIQGREWLTYGKDLCLDALKITASLSDQLLMIRWYDDSGREVAYAPLNRVLKSGRKRGKK